jgi:glycosyltransferase involved in cell wall biosynthesis
MLVTKKNIWKEPQLAELLNKQESTGPGESDLQVENTWDRRPAVIIVVPPWPGSGTARVIQNQTDYYRQRGLHSFLVAVPIHWAYLDTSPIWKEISEGIHDLGADQVFVTTLDRRGYEVAKYTSSFRHVFRGTALDWIIDIGRSTRLSNQAAHSLRNATVILLHVNYVYTLGFALRLRKQLVGKSARMPIILDTHDIQSHLLLERGDLNPWTRRQDSLERLVRAEITMLQNVDALMHLSVDDLRFFQSHLPKKPHFLCMPTIDETFVKHVNATPSQLETFDLLFVGQNHVPNLTAMKWFFGEVWPHIAHHNFNLKVAGAVDVLVRACLPKVYEEFRCCFVGQQSDLAPYYRAARCVIAPMVSGSGTSIKTIEALALGKPFVGTSKAFRGMPMDLIERAGLRPHDDPQDFANAIMDALSMERQAGALSRATYESVFSRQAALCARDEALRIATNAPSRG